MRAGIGEPLQRDRQHRRDRGEPEDGQRQDQDRQHGVLDLAGLDLLAEVLGRAADHQARHEDGDQRHDHHAVEA